MLTLEAVSYRYAGAARPSLRDVSLTFNDGEVVGVAGPSEAGKTTLCLVISGLAPRTVGGTLSGRVLLDGADVAPLAIHDLAGRIGIAFASPSTQLSGVAATVYEEVAFGPMNLGLPRADIIERTHEALESLRITALGPRDPARLSGGQQQLVAIAGLLAQRPTHLVLDEPTAQLDPLGTRLVGEALMRLATAGSSIIVVEQKTDLLEAVCRRVLVMDAGQVVLDGEAEEVLGNARLSSLQVAVPGPIRLRRAAESTGLTSAQAVRLKEALS